MLIFYSGLAQLVERWPVNPKRAGSSPAPGVSLNSRSICMKNSDVVAWLSLIGHGFWVYKQYLQKPKVKLIAQIKQHDNNKYLNAAMDPINRLEIFITNHSEKTIGIRDIKLLYNEKAKVSEGTLNLYAHYQIEKVRGKNLSQGEQIILSFNYVQNDDRLVLDHLKGIKVISNYEHRYTIQDREFETQIKKIQQLKPPNPENLERARKREKQGRGLCKRTD